MQNLTTQNNFIHRRLTSLESQIAEKGMTSPNAFLAFNYIGYATYLKVEGQVNGTFYSKSFKDRHGASVKNLFDQAQKWIDDLDSLDELKRKDFLTALGRLIDLGKDSGIEIVDDFDPMAALTKTMEKLSGNIITDESNADPE